MLERVTSAHPGCLVCEVDGVVVRCSSDFCPVGMHAACAPVDSNPNMPGWRCPLCAQLNSDDVTFPPPLPTLGPEPLRPTLRLKELLERELGKEISMRAAEARYAALSKEEKNKLGTDYYRSFSEYRTRRKELIEAQRVYRRSAEAYQNMFLRVSCQEELGSDCSLMEEDKHHRLSALQGAQERVRTLIAQCELRLTQLQK